MKPGDAIRYRSMAGDFWPATIAAVHSDGTVDVTVDGLLFSHRPIHTGKPEDCPKRQCVIDAQKEDERINS